MNNIIREFKSFDPEYDFGGSPINQPAENYKTAEYPNTFEFYGEVGLYKLEISKDLETFRLIFPEGKLVYSTTESLFSWAKDESIFGEYEHGYLWRWMRRTLIIMDSNEHGSDVTKWKVCETVDINRLDPPIVLMNYTYHAETGDDIHVAVSADGVVQVRVPGFDTTKNFHDLYKDRPEILVIDNGGLNTFIQGKLYEISGDKKYLETKTG